ncbi:NAD(P)H-binding protein [Pedobacter sp. HMF7647]|uniref:NAD(P)H-binding protein n=1 Tax=Hufsiella arboris TaxID=2695275 RepID=A0A7K1Y5Y1_9SPHI|nr:NAD(P)H-binding protein [Hufsiella arboris]MXV49987.1 NAD(P)H-binding protein [Hufsiella arboris]
MKKHSKIAIIGGTGKAGKYLVKQLLAQNFPVKLLLREPGKFDFHHPSIELLAGDARNPQAIKSLVEGCGAVISTLGQPANEPSIFSTATKNVLDAMKHFGIRRYVLITGLNVDTTYDKKSEKVLAATEWMLKHYAETSLDKQAEYQLLLNSAVDWTLVRLPLIEQTELKGSLVADLENCPGEKVSSTDLALFLVQQLSDKRFVKAAPFVATV